MTKLRQWRDRSASLSFRVLVTLIGVVSLTMLLAQALRLRADFASRSRLLEAHAALVADIAADGIARPLFDFNTPVVQSAVAALAKDPDFLGAAVHDADGKPVAQTGRILDAGGAMVLRKDLQFDNNGTRTPVGTLVLALSRDSVLRFLREQMLQDAITTALLLGSVFLTVSLSLRRISRPLRAMHHAMERLASGDADCAIGGGARRDEIGSMARAMTVFRDNVRALRRADEQQRAQEEAKERRRESLEQLIGGFVQRIDGVACGVSGAARNTEADAGLLSDAAGEMSDHAARVATAAQNAGQSLAMVSTLTSDLSQVIAHITRETAAAGQVTMQAVQQATAGTETIQGLANAAERIGAVVDLIRSVAAQTNLLALNATIEAARAGDAGKGFAVVAGEVKGLAAQTATATEDIQRQVAAIQS
jgi:methyl-accepting chemotaxis protein